MKIISFYKRHATFIDKIAVSVVLIVLVLCSISIGSCNISPNKLVLLSGDYTTPQLDSWKMESANKLNLYFTRKVCFPELIVYKLFEGTNATVSSDINASLPDLTVDRVENEDICLPIHFSKSTVVGTKYLLVGTAQDEHGNTLDFTLPFEGYNNVVPAMIFSEICTEYSKTTTGAKVEFVEFVVLSDGNTAGMQFESGYDGKEKVYTFPNIEVYKDDYIVLHMRTIDENAVSEFGDDLLLSDAKNSSVSRDIWVDNSSARIGKDDILLLRARENGNLLDAVVFSRSDKEEWAKDAMLIAAKEAFSANIWTEGFTPDIASLSDSLTTTRTLCRQNVSDCIEQYKIGVVQPFRVTALDWCVVNTSCATPGTANSTEKYER